MSRRDPSQVSVKTAATVTATVLGLVLAAWFFWQTDTALLLTLLSLLIAVALNHIVHWLEQRGWNRGLAVAAAMLGLVGIVVGLGWLVVPVLVSQAQQLVTAWPQLLQGFQHSGVYEWLERHFGVRSLLAQLQTHAPSLVGEAIGAVRVVLEAIGGIVTMLFIVTFMLATGRPLLWGMLAQARPETRQAWSKLTTDIYHALGGYVLGQLTIVFIQMLVTSTWLFIMHVPYFLALGVLSGAASLIPFAGATVMGVAVSLVAWGTQGLWTGAATAAYYVAYQQFENHVLAPIVYRRTIQMNPLAILLAALFMFDLAGIAGAVLAVPLVASGQIVIQTVLRHRRERLNIPPTSRRPELLEEDAEPERPRPGNGGRTLS